MKQAISCGFFASLFSMLWFSLGCGPQTSSEETSHSAKAQAPQVERVAPKITVTHESFSNRQESEGIKSIEVGPSAETSCITEMDCGMIPADTEKGCFPCIDGAGQRPVNRETAKHLMGPHKERCSELKEQLEKEYGAGSAGKTRAPRKPDESCQYNWATCEEGTCILAKLSEDELKEKFEKIHKHNQGGQGGHPRSAPAAGEPDNLSEQASNQWGPGIYGGQGGGPSNWPGNYGSQGGYNSQGGYPQGYGQGPGSQGGQPHNWQGGQSGSGYRGMPGDQSNPRQFGGTQGGWPGNNNPHSQGGYPGGQPGSRQNSGRGNLPWGGTSGTQEFGGRGHSGYQPYSGQNWGDNPSGNSLPQGYNSRQKYPDLNLGNFSQGQGPTNYNPMGNSSWGGAQGAQGYGRQGYSGLNQSRSGQNWGNNSPSGNSLPQGYNSRQKYPDLNLGNFGQGPSSENYNSLGNSSWKGAQGLQGYGGQGYGGRGYGANQSRSGQNFSNNQWGNSLPQGYNSRQGYPDLNQSNFGSTRGNSPWGAAGQGGGYQGHSGAYGQGNRAAPYSNSGYGRSNGSW